MARPTEPSTDYEPNPNNEPAPVTAPALDQDLDMGL